MAQHRVKLECLVRSGCCKSLASTKPKNAAIVRCTPDKECCYPLLVELEILLSMQLLLFHQPVSHPYKSDKVVRLPDRTFSVLPLLALHVTAYHLVLKIKKVNKKASANSGDLNLMLFTLRIDSKIKHIYIYIYIYIYI